VAPMVLATATFPTEFSRPVSSPPILWTTLIRRLLARACFVYFLYYFSIQSGEDTSGKRRRQGPVGKFFVKLSVGRDCEAR
jgi:hypothetical protein